MAKGELPVTNPLRDSKLPATQHSPAVGENFAHQQTSRLGSLLRLVFAVCCTWVLTSHFHASYKDNVSSQADAAILGELCPQAAPLSPSSALMSELDGEYTSEEFKAYAIESLSGAVQIPTEMWDDLDPPGQDSRWEIFSQIHAYFEQRFPLVHAHLRKTEVNIYALVYHWQGTDDSLSPMLLTAHQDVVPVELLTVDQWINPPFSGYYDGDWIWGRGSSDDKSILISILTSVEKLLEKGFKPKRSIVLAFGIDEERGGVSGASAIAEYLLETYGEDGFSIIVDEGSGYSVAGDTLMSIPAVAEKGKLDARVEISAPGGHSSVPPAHTTIGLLAAVIKEIESKPHPTHLNRSSTYYSQLQCQAEHDPSLSSGLKKLIKDSQTSDKALTKLQEELARTQRMFGPLTGTTQAIDIIHGGVKSNALPENAFFIMNHRIDSQSSVAVVKQHITDVVGPFALGLNLSVDAFGKQYGKLEKDSAYGHLQIADAFDTGLEPAPITPTFGSGPYELLAGTVISSLATSKRTGMPRKAFVSPSLATGNTDTKWYWKLTKHIFRYGHLGSGDSYNGAHTINEAVRAEGYLEIIRFHTRLILNGHDSDLLS